MIKGVSAGAGCREHSMSGAIFRLIERKALAFPPLRDKGI